MCHTPVNFNGNLVCLRYALRMWVCSLLDLKMLTILLVSWSTFVEFSGEKKQISAMKLARDGTRTFAMK